MVIGSTVPSVCCWCLEAHSKPAVLPATISLTLYCLMEQTISIPRLNWLFRTFSSADHCYALQNYDSERHENLCWSQICLLAFDKTYSGGSYAVCHHHMLQMSWNCQHSIQLLSTNNTSCTDWFRFFVKLKSYRFAYCSVACSLWDRMLLLPALNFTFRARVRAGTDNSLKVSHCHLSVPHWQ